MSNTGYILCISSIISGIGEIDRLNHLKKLVAFAGIGPSVFESDYQKRL
jgi:hypothetical protein